MQSGRVVNTGRVVNESPFKSPPILLITYIYNFMHILICVCTYIYICVCVLVSFFIFGLLV